MDSFAQNFIFGLFLLITLGCGGAFSVGIIRMSDLVFIQATVLLSLVQGRYWYWKMILFNFLSRVNSPFKVLRNNIRVIYVKSLLDKKSSVEHISKWISHCLTTWPLLKALLTLFADSSVNLSYHGSQYLCVGDDRIKVLYLVQSMNHSSVISAVFHGSIKKRLAAHLF